MIQLLKWSLQKETDWECLLVSTSQAAHGHLSSEVLELNGRHFPNTHPPEKGA